MKPYEGKAPIQETKGETPKTQPTVEDIKFIAEYAITAPTGDNCQPFHLKWEEGVLKIRYSDILGAHALNYKNQPSLLILGTMIEIIDIACSHLNFKISVDFPNQIKNSITWAEVRFYPEARAKDPLLPYVKWRCTDRRPFQKAPVDLSHFEFDTPSTAQTGEWHYSLFNKDLTKLVLDADEYVWETKPAYTDLFKWVRLTSREKNIHFDGMSSEEMGMNFIETLFFRGLRRFPNLVELVWRLGFKWSMRMRNYMLIKNSAGAVLFTNSGNSEQDFINMGRKIIRFWIKCSQQGLSVQPLTAASLIVRSALLDAPSYMSAKHKMRMQKGVEALRSTFNFSENTLPLWMFRIGQKPKKSLKRFSKRRPMDQYLFIK